jgi:hypothetical protein
MYHDDVINIIIGDDDDNDTNVAGDGDDFCRADIIYLSLYHISVYLSIYLSHRVVEYAARQMKLLANSNRSGDTTTEERKSKEDDEDEESGGGQRTNSR